MRYLIHQLLEQSAAERPDSVALIDGDRNLTYAELDRVANQLARRLIELGVCRGDRVALYLDKSADSIIGIYGVLKAGAAYVPLDPQAPTSRLAYITTNAGVRVLVTGIEKTEAVSDLRDEAPSIADAVMLNDPGVRSELAALPAQSPQVPAIEGDLAYILYTSGSTGVPKGVMLSHRNCLAFVKWAVEEFGVTADDRLSSHAPLHFDLSTFDLYAAALAGAPVVLVPAQTSVFPSQVRTFIEAQGITVWYSVPSILTMLVLRGGLTTESCPGLRTILFAGEVFPTRYLRELTELLPHVRFANLYGPTETNVCTWHEVRPLGDGDETIPIGRAIDGVDVYALNDAGQRAGVGEEGELYVRGPTVMQGYLGDPEKTAARLVPDPLGDIIHQPTYRTGDLVTLTAGGAYRFLGRRDEQIKSRGYRIELGEIETAIYAHPAVSECAVVAVPDEIVTNRVLAYVSLSGPLDVGSLTQFCAERLPHYMVPERFEFADELPRTSTGKVDRRALAGQAAAAG
jgi:amino acid adenylation domain-containing protein